MRTQLGDADPQAERVQVDLLRRMGSRKRAKLMRTLSSKVIGLAKRAIRRQHPELDAEGLKLKFIEIHYGAELAERIRSARAQRPR